MTEKIEIVLSAEELLRALGEIDQKVQETEDRANEVIKSVDKATLESFNNTLNMARAAYTIGLGLVKAGGASVSYLVRGVASAVFQTVATLAPLALGKAMSTEDWVTFGLTMGQLTAATTAAIAAEAENMEFARQMRGVTMMFNGVQSMVGVISF